MHATTRLLLILLSITVLAAFMTRGCRRNSYDTVKGSGEAAIDLTKEQLDEWEQAVRKRLPEDGPAAVSTAAEVFHEITRAADEIGGEILPLTIEQEIEYGRQVHQTVRREHTLLNNPQQLARMKRLATPLLVHSRRPELTYSFYIIDSDEINAFAHLGGYVYVNRGLIDATRSDAELQFVLGHEIGHIEHKHVLRGAGYAGAAGEVGGDLGAGVVMFLYRNIAVGYCEKHEFEADLWSYDTMRKIGRSKQERLAFLRRMTELIPSPQHAEPDGTLGRIGKELRDHYRTHPPGEERVAVLEKLP